MTSIRYKIFAFATLVAVVILFFYGRNSLYVIQNEELKSENFQLKSRESMTRVVRTETRDSNLELENERLRKENERLRATISQFKNTKNPSYFDRKIPESRTLDRRLLIDTTFAVKFQKHVTILIYSRTSAQCVLSQINKIRESLRTIRIILADANNSLEVHDKDVEILHDITTEGQALNGMIKKVQTSLFLYLGDGAGISKFDSDNSVAWLYHALEVLPELDIVGGSYIRYNASTVYPVLDVQCYRHRMCYWVFEQRYEYQYSVGDMMLCEETSSSFMARTASIAKLPRFDETLTSMTTTDFFYRVRHKAVVGLRPEVFFDVTHICTCKQRTNKDETKRRIPFMVKHDLIRVQDSFGNRYTLPTSHPHKSSFVYHTQGGFNTVTMIETLKSLLLLTDDFFRSKNITYLVEAGVALGGLKMRDVLPWDTGDIDTIFYGKWDRVHGEFKKYCADRKVGCLFRFVPYGQGKEILLEYEYKMGANTMFYIDQDPPSSSDFILMLIHGRLIPVQRTVFQHFRKSYQNEYLQNRDHAGTKLLECSVLGHHACAPRAFSQGGGHWKEFYCDR